jgi:hypothetical protein
MDNRRIINSPANDISLNGVGQNLFSVECGSSIKSLGQAAFFSYELPALRKPKKKNSNLFTVTWYNSKVDQIRPALNHHTSKWVVEQYTSHVNNEPPQTLSKPKNMPKRPGRPNSFTS